MRVKHSAFLASALVLAAAVALNASHAGQRTTNDGVYTTAQADAAKAQFESLCAECHAFTVAAKRKPEDLPLGDDPFFKVWEGNALSELLSVIVLTMPNDGRAIVDEPEALGLLAYILQQNGAPAGSEPLTKESASALLARPKK